MTQSATLAIPSDLATTPLIIPNNATEVTGGDLHANTLKAISIAIKFGIISAEESKLNLLYLTFAYYYNNDESTMVSYSWIKYILKQFNYDTTKTYRAIGDTLGDRGQNDGYTLEFYLQLYKHRVPFTILLGNHESAFFKKIAFNKDTILPGQMKSVSNMIDTPTLSDRFNNPDFLENVLFKHIKLIDYSFTGGKNDPDELTIFTHAPAGIEVIQGFLKYYHLSTYHDLTTKAGLMKAIDAINTTFQNNGYSAFLEALDIPESEDPMQNPFYYVTWNRNLDACEYMDDVMFINGHDSATHTDEEKAAQHFTLNDFNGIGPGTGQNPQAVHLNSVDGIDPKFILTNSQSTGQTLTCETTPKDEASTLPDPSKLGLSPFQIAILNNNLEAIKEIVPTINIDSDICQFIGCYASPFALFSILGALTPPKVKEFKSAAVCIAAAVNAQNFELVLHLIIEGFKIEDPMELIEIISKSKCFPPTTLNQLLSHPDVEALPQRIRQEIFDHMFSLKNANAISWLYHLNLDCGYIKTKCTEYLFTLENYMGNQSFYIALLKTGIASFLKDSEGHTLLHKSILHPTLAITILEEIFTSNTKIDSLFDPNHDALMGAFKLGNVGVINVLLQKLWDTDFSGVYIERTDHIASLVARIAEEKTENGFNIFSLLRTCHCPAANDLIKALQGYPEISETKPQLTPALQWMDFMREAPMTTDFLPINSF